MTKRRRILSDPTAGPGRVMVQGRRQVFGLGGVWKSDALPRPGVVVDAGYLVLVCIRRFLVARACDTAVFDENE